MTLKNKAFTLIELLAVIIILAIVALIATPIILNVIEDSRKSANLSEVNLILSGANNLYASSFITTDPSILEAKTKFNGTDNLYDYIKTTNEKPTAGNLKINESGKVELSIFMDGICYTKGFEDSIVLVDENIKFLEDCVPFSINQSTSSMKQNGWYTTDVDVTISTTGQSLKYCLEDNCTPNIEVSDNTTQITLTETTKVCAVGIRNNTESELNCITYNIDKIAATIVPKSETRSYAQGTSLETSTLFDIQYGLSSGSVACSPANISSLNEGKHQVSCTVTSNNGTQATANREVAIGNYMVDGHDFNTIFKALPSYSTIKNIIFEYGITNYETAIEKRDLSLYSDESVVGYVDGTTFRIQANGTLYAHEDLGGYYDGTSWLKYAIFNDLDNVTSIILNNFNTKNTTNMAFSFGYSDNLINLDLGENFDTSNVTNMNFMFSDNTSLKSLNLGEKFYTNNVTNMFAMFVRNYDLISLDLGENFNTSKVTTTAYMFASLTNISSIDLGEKFDTKNVTNMEAMFADNPNMTTLTLGNKFDTSNVSIMKWMFDDSNKLATLDLGPLFNMNKITNKDSMFTGSSVLNNIYVPNNTVLNAIKSGTGLSTSVVVTVKDYN